MKRFKLNFAVIALLISAAGTYVAHAANRLDGERYFRQGRELNISELDDCIMPVTEVCFEIWSADLTTFKGTQEGTWIGQ